MAQKSSVLIPSPTFAVSLRGRQRLLGLPICRIVPHSIVGLQIIREAQAYISEQHTAAVLCAVALRLVHYDLLRRPLTCATKNVSLSY